MRKRDMYILCGLGALIVFGGYWMLLLSPKLKDANDLSSQIAKKEQAVKKAKSTAQTSQQAKVNFTSTYASLAKLGKAAPEQGSIDDDVPSLLLQVNHGAEVTRTKFSTFTPGAGESGATEETTTPSSPAAAAPGGGAAAGDESGSSGAQSPSQQGSDAAAGGGATGAAGAATGSLNKVAYAYKFRGRFFDLEDMIHYLTHLVEAERKKLKITGRLISIDSIAFTSESGAATAGGTAVQGSLIQAEIAVSAYTVPVGQDLLGGTTPTGPPGADGQPQSASSGSGSAGSSDAVPGAPPQAQPATPPSAVVKRP